MIDSPALLTVPAAPGAILRRCCHCGEDEYRGPGLTNPRRGECAVRLRKALDERQAVRP